MNRRISYRLNKMNAYAREYRMSSSSLPRRMITARWLYLRGDRGEKMEKRIFTLYEEMKKVKDPYAKIEVT